LTVAGLDRGSPAGAGAVNGRISLPDVGGLPARVAVRRLHALGLRVARIGVGDIRATQPPPGTPVLPGDTIRLTYRGASHE
jgi:beta-lactam-binding protein with PASTA domain